MWLNSDQTRFYEPERYVAWYDPDVTGSEKLKDRLQPSAENFSMSTEPPILTFEAEGLEAYKLAKMPGISLVSVARGRATDYATSVNPEETSAGYSNSRYVHNQQGNFADGIKIGIVETISKYKECGIFESHEALRGATVSYLWPQNVACSEDSECTSSLCGQCSDDSGVCRYTNPHPSQVASRIASSTDEELLHAAKAHLVVANSGIGQLANSSALAAVYQHLNDQDVSVVNESYGVSGAAAKFHPNDYVREWFARYRGMTFVKAAGNHGIFDTEEDNEASCHALNALCVGGTHADGSYDSVADDERYFVPNPDPTKLGEGSAWDNPDFGCSNSSECGEKEAERPDVVSEAQDTWVMDTSAPDAWQSGAHGTSYAAPTVTGLLALLDKDCGPFTPAGHRAAIRTAAYRPHSVEDSPSDPRYPIPGQSPDSYAGAGIPLAKAISLYCRDQEGEPDLRIQSGAIDPTDDSEWRPLDEYEFMTPEAFPETPEDLIVTHEQGLRSPGAQTRKLWDIGPGANRVRVTFSYYTCPPSDGQDPVELESVDKTAPAVDFDIILCSEDAQECAAISESEDDTNEGFDVMVPSELSSADDLAVYLIKPDGSEVSTCEGPHEGKEPWSSAIAVWR